MVTRSCSYTCCFIKISRENFPRCNLKKHFPFFTIWCIIKSVLQMVLVRTIREKLPGLNYLLRQKAFHVSLLVHCFDRIEPILIRLKDDLQGKHSYYQFQFCKPLKASETERVARDDLHFYMFLSFSLRSR